MTFINHLWRLILFRSRPQDLPYSKNLLLSVFLFSCLSYAAVCLMLIDSTSLNMLRESQQSLSLPTLLFIVIMFSYSAQLCVLHGLLSMHGKKERFVQASTNYIGVEALVTMSIVAVTLVILNISPKLIESMTFLSLPLWALLQAVKTHIIRHTFEQNTFQAFIKVLVIQFGASLMLLLVTIAAQIIFGVQIK